MFDFWRAPAAVLLDFGSCGVLSISSIISSNTVAEFAACGAGGDGGVGGVGGGGDGGDGDACGTDGTSCRGGAAGMTFVVGFAFRRRSFNSWK